MQETKVIGLLLTNIRNDFFAPLFSGIDRVVRQNDYNLLVATYHADDCTGSTPPVGPHNTDGLIVFADSLNDADIIKYHQRNFPMVLIHRSSPMHYDIPAVTIENKTATIRMIEHLILVHQRKKILFVSGPDSQEDSHWREVGYHQALQKNQVPFDAKLKIAGGFEREVAYQRMKEFLGTEHPKFDAVFACDDASAIGVLDALLEAGFNVPKDISVVGFNDLPLSAYLSPPLTTIKAPTELVGQTAAQYMFELLTSDRVEPITLLPTDLIIRHSCGC
jgi:DNA-binding LacI/PurR family transcriptional regulator